MSLWNDPVLNNLFLKNTPLIDVRAPVEFREGSIPYSVNLPILTDEERHLIGICYKSKGQDDAIILGHQLVSGEIKNNRVAAWMSFIEQNPTAEVFCFRGGLRSEISCQWLSESGIKRSPITGGYKRIRQFFLSWINEAPRPQLFRLGGLTGSGKTKLLHHLNNHMDLEDFANHRGSAFGYKGEQPSQITFENLIGLSLLKNQSRLIVEDESATLGKLSIPLNFFKSMNQSPLLILRTPIEERVLTIFNDYVLHQNALFFLNATKSITKKLGGVRSTKLLQEISRAFELGYNLQDHQTWISEFLLDYYDPLYQKALQRDKKLIAFEGDSNEIKQWWSHFSS